MNFPKLSFPLTVDFGGTGYWIGDAGPFPYGVAVTQFFCDDDLADNIGDGLPLMHDLEDHLQTFGAHLRPYVQEQPASAKLFLYPEQSSVSCSVCFTFRPVVDDAGVMVERYTFSCLRDFLHMELWRAIAKGNAPRQCRLCGRWFLHRQGDKTMYCDRVAPGETEKTCREAGPRAVFEWKIQSEETWKIYKRAYKKYYARVMKGTMSREDFNAWVAHAAAQRDFTIELLRAETTEDGRSRRIEALRKELNRK